MNAVINFINSDFPDLNRWIFLVVILILWFIEKSKIPVAPVSFVLGWIGEKINHTQNIKIEKLSEQLNELSLDLEDHKVESWRSEIISFSNQLRIGEIHTNTKEAFDRIIKLHDKYEKYIKLHKLENGQIDVAYGYILDIYNKCLRENSFL